MLSSNSCIVEYKREDLIFKNKSKLYSVYLILEGAVKLRDNRDQLYYILSQGEIFGFEALFSLSPIGYSACTFEGAKILQVESHAFTHLMNGNHQFLQRVLTSVVDNHQHLVQSLLDFKSHKIHGALAAFLLFYDDRNCLHHLTRKDIGEILGYSRENVTKIIKCFEEEGYIKEDGKNIQLLCRPSLELLKKNG